MPRNHPELDRERKRSELLIAARRLLLRDGYEGTSMARLAAAAGVAPNTLYWYFADKDALLVAVVDELAREALGEYGRRRRGSLESQLRWLLGLLLESRGLIATVHARALVSPQVRTWHEGFHRLVEAAIAAELGERGLARGLETHAARGLSYVMEGMVAHDLSPAEQRGILRWLASLGGAADGSD